MSKWIRHRGSKRMPKCLEGKRFIFRFRDGYVTNEVVKKDLSQECWRHRGDRFDIMAYRISGDINPPDYSKGFPVGTTAKDIGAKYGDQFAVVDDLSGHGFNIGTIVKYKSGKEDIIHSQEFTDGLSSRWITFHELAHIQPKTAIELQAEEVGIPEPVQEWPEDRMDIVGQNGNDGLHYNAVPTSKYQRTINGVTVDVYDVLAAFGVTCQARGHAIKKLLMAGQRGHKDEAQDLREAVQAIERSIDLVKK